MMRDYETYRRQWRKDNREKMQEQGRRHRAKHRLTIKARNAQAHAFRRGFLARWKLAAGCYDCGYAESAAALDFDHVGPKSFSMNRAASRSWRAVVAELAECVVRCANCHRIKTHGGK